MACEAGRRFLAGLGFLTARQQTRTFCYGDRRERVLALTRKNEWQMLKKWGEGLRIKRTCNGLSKVTKMASMCFQRSSGVGSREKTVGRHHLVNRFRVTRTLIFLDHV